MRWPGVLLALIVLAGCVDEPAALEAAPPRSADANSGASTPVPGGLPGTNASAVNWTLQPFAYDGATRTMVCVPNGSTNACTAVFGIAGRDDYHRIAAPRGARSLNVTLSWSPVAPTHEQLRLAVAAARVQGNGLYLRNVEQAIGKSPLSVHVGDFAWQPEESVVLVYVQGESLTPPPYRTIVAPSQEFKASGDVVLAT